MRWLIFLIGILFAVNLYGQNTVYIDLKWGDQPIEMLFENNDPVKISNLEGAYFDGEEFLYTHRWERKLDSKWRLELRNVELESVTDLDLRTINHFTLPTPEEPSFEIKNINQREKGWVSILVNPFVKVGGTIQRITSLEFHRSPIDVIQMKSSKYVENSVLAPGSGDWYKIRVLNNGVHRINYDLLKEIGVDVDNINPQHINIYGNGFGRLPENNSEYRPDDLIKNAIFIAGEQDGSFDANDFILFYGRGPHKWQESTNANNQFERILNNYQTYSAYFININTNASPKRVQNAQMSNDAPTNVVTDYNSFNIHERELVNLIKGGQRWYGEQFDTELSQSFNFNIPNLKTDEPVIVRSAMASSIGGGSFELLYNGSSIASKSFNQAPENSYRREELVTFPNAFNPTSSSFNIQVRFNRTNPSDVAYLDFIQINARSNLSFSGSQFEFRDILSVDEGNISNFRISSFPTNGIIWETTELGNPKLIAGQLAGGIYDFTVTTDSLRSFIAFNNSGYLTPTFDKKVEHQNLHGLDVADYLIVTHPLFLSEANRLGDLHASQGLTSHVVVLEKIYNEFSGGTQDPTAIKMFAKMFYDRANGDPELMPKYLCLFGDGTYDPLDRVPDNNYMCPVYHTVNSESYISTIVSDDYFGFLDEEEAFSQTDVLDIAVGRLIATTPEHATNLVNKIEHYMKNGSSLYSSAGVLTDENGFVSKHGDWRLRYTTIADDEENGYFINNDLEPAYEYVKSNHPEMNPNKIYSDAFQKVSTAGGTRYPDVNREINRSIEAGTLMMCFVGHGGPSGAAQQRIITIGQINDWKNIGRLTLFASATCEFARIDDNERVSAGEWMALNPIGGAIALMTTSRAVYFSTNSETTARFFEQVFLRDEKNKPRSFGDIITDTKNAVGTGTSNNKRSFMLLGDPALKIALPYQKAVLDSVNGIAINEAMDTIRALSKTRLTGHIEDQFGNKLTGFKGIMQPTIFDKPRTEKTLGQHVKSPVIEFEQQKNMLFRGRVSVKSGAFDFNFIVPKDIDYTFGQGKASFYAFDEADETAGGYSKSFIIGGVDTTGIDDNEGPEIELFLNDENFVNGGITDETPILIAKLFDESGINTVGTGIGHDITVVLDGETNNAIILNEYYESDLDTYQSGSLRYQFEKLEPGLHTLTFKAWDVNNNSSEATLEFNVQERQDVALRHVLNYPNPFTTSTTFMFEHNQPAAALETKIEVFTVTGRLVKTILQDVKTQGFRVEGIPWNGRDDFGDQLAKGVYVYRLTVRNPDGQSAQAMQKLYLLK